MEHRVFVDSRDRNIDKNPEASSYKIVLPKTYHDVVASRLVTAELPVSSILAFDPSRANTVLRIGSGVSFADVEIPAGTYTLENIAGVLESVIQAVFPGISVSASTSTQKLTFTGGLSVDATEVSGLAYTLGFDAGVVYASSGGILTSPRCVRLRPETCVYLDIEELNEIGSFGSIAKVPLVDSGVLYKEADGSPNIAANPCIPRLRELRVRWRYRDGSLVNFNGAEHSFTLALVCVQRTAGKPAENIPPARARSIVVNPVNPVNPEPQPAVTKPQPAVEPKYPAGAIKYVPWVLAGGTVTYILYRKMRG